MVISSSPVNLIEASELCLNLLPIQLGGVPSDVSEEHVFEEVSRSLGRMFDSYGVHVSEACGAVANSCIGICHVETPNELNIINKLDFLMVPLEQLGDSSLAEEIVLPVLKGVISYTNSTSSLKFPDGFFIGVKVEVVND